MSGETRPKSKLVAGKKDMHEFCVRVFDNPEPIIVVWATEEKPDFEADKTSDGVQLIDAVNLFFKDMIDSLFFPSGFVEGEWNRVLVAIKDEYSTQLKHSGEGLIRGWIMGADFDSQMILGGKILVKLP